MERSPTAELAPIITRMPPRNSLLKIVLPESRARAGFTSSMALGQGAVATRANQVMVGTATNTYTLAGIASAQSRAAQSGATHFVTSDASGNLAVTAFSADSIANLDGRVSSLEAGLVGLNRSLTETRVEARRGIATAIAMASAPMPSAPGRTSWATNVGHFKGETAFGASLAYRFDTSRPLAITAGYSFGGGDSHGARIGLAGEF